MRSVSISRLEFYALALVLLANSKARRSNHHAPPTPRSTQSTGLFKRAPESTSMFSRRVIRGEGATENIRVILNCQIPQVMRTGDSGSQLPYQEFPLLPPITWPLSDWASPFPDPEVPLLPLSSALIYIHNSQPSSKNQPAYSKELQ